MSLYELGFRAINHLLVLSKILRVALSSISATTISQLLAIFCFFIRTMSPLSIHSLSIESHLALSRK